MSNMYKHAKYLLDEYIRIGDNSSTGILSRENIERQLHAIGYDVQWNVKAEAWMLVTTEPTVAYAIKIGGMWFYYHASCFDEATTRNINHLDQAILEQGRTHYVPLSATSIPDNAVCSALYCWKPLREEPQ